MLTDPDEIRIIARARQPNVADPTRSREPFMNIFEDFFDSVSLEGAHLLDLGPGHYDFAELAKERGATTSAVDNDPAVIQLGLHKGYDVRALDLKSLRRSDLDDRSFDGVFCKFSMNAFWFVGDRQGLADHVDAVADLVLRGGWAWIAPWNGVPKRLPVSDEVVNETLEVQAAAFRSHGFEAFELDIDHARRYGITGRTVNTPLFLLNIDPPDRLSGARRTS